MLHFKGLYRRASDLLDSAVLPKWSCSKWFGRWGALIWTRVFGNVMSPIAPLEAVPATALGAQSSAVSNDSPSFFDALTATGLKPPPNSAAPSKDSPSSSRSSEEDPLPPTTSSNVPHPKNKDVSGQAPAHPFLPGAITATAMLELTHRRRSLPTSISAALIQRFPRTRPPLQTAVVNGMHLLHRLSLPLSSRRVAP
jgi:hypothetical protein